MQPAQRCALLAACALLLACSDQVGDAAEEVPTGRYARAREGEVREATERTGDSENGENTPERSPRENTSEAQRLAEAERIEAEAQEAEAALEGDDVDANERIGRVPALPPLEIDVSGTSAEELDSDDPLANLEDLAFVEAAEADVAGVANPNAEVPPGECRFAGAPVRLWPAAGVAEIVHYEDVYFIAGYAPTGAAASAREELYLLAVESGGLPRLVLRHRLPSPPPRERGTPPAILPIAENHVALAVIDGNADVFVSVGAPSRLSNFVKVGENADTRFSPALGVVGDRIVLAYTRQGTMSSVVARSFSMAGEVQSEAQVTSTQSGRAPIFLPGQDAVYEVDARQARSTVVRRPIALSEDALSFGEGQVVAVVSNLYDPATLALGTIGSEQAPNYLVGYNAVGQAAQTAVGLVSSSALGAPPVPIVSSSGYGFLSVDAAGSGAGVVFAASASTAPEPESPRKLVIRVVQGGARQPGVALELQREGGAQLPRIAGSQGRYAVSYTGADGVFLAHLTCRL